MIQTLSRNGFTAEDVKSALHAARGNRKVKFYYNLLSKAGVYKRTLDTVTSGSVSLNALDEIKRKARFTLKDDGTIDFLSDRIKPYMGVWVDGERTYTLDSQADWQAGTLSPQCDASSSAGDVKLYRPTASFARNSVAYLPDGTQVANAVARYWWGRYHNLLTANQASFEDGALTGWGVQNYPAGSYGSVGVSTDRSSHGTYSVKIEKTVSTAAEYGLYINTLPRANMVAGRRYMILAKVWLSSDSTAPFGWQGDLAGTFQTYATHTQVRNEWVTLSFTVVWSGSNTNLRLMFLGSSGVGTAYVDEILISEAVSDGQGGWIVPTWCPGNTGKGVIVEEGTTPILGGDTFLDTDSNADGVANGWTAYVTGGAVGNRTMDSGQKTFGRTASQKLQRTGQTTSTDRYGISSGTRTGVSSPNSIQVLLNVTALDVGAQVRVHIDYADSGGAWIDSTSTAVIAVTNGWTTVKIENKVNANIARETVYIWIQGGNGTVYVQAVMPENKAYCTSLTGATRSPETLTLPTTGLSPSQGTVEMWVYVNAMARRQVANQWPRVFQIRAASGTSQQYGVTVWHNPSAASWSFLTGDGTNTTGANVADSYTPDGWHHFAMRWSVTEASLWIDGIKRGTIENPLLPAAFASTIQIGNDNGNYFLNTYFDDIHISTVARSDADILAHGTATAPLTADTNTLTLLHMDGNLTSDYPSQGTYITKSIDVGIDNTSSIGYLITTTLPTGTTVTVPRWRDSADNVTWSAWKNTVGGRTNGRTQQYVQFEVILATTDANATPVLSKLVAKQNGGGWAEFALGEFLLISPKRSDENGMVIREVEAYDQTIILRDDKVDGKFLIVAGTQYTSALRTILEGAGITRHNITSSTKTLPADREWEGGTSKLRIVNDLLESLNYNSIFFDEDGYAICSPYVLPADAPSEYDYRDDNLSVIARPVTQELDVFDIPNKWVFVVSEPDRPVLRSTYTNDNPNSKLSTVSRGLTKVDYRAVDAADQETLDALVQRAATNAMSIFEHISWASWAMPFHSYMSDYTFTYSALGASDKYREISWSMDLSENGTMTHECRKSVSVA